MLSILWHVALGITALIIFIHVQSKSPLFLITPPISLLRVQAFALLSPFKWLFTSNLDSTSPESKRIESYHMPIKSRLFLIWRFFLALSLLPLWNFLWLLDDILFPSYLTDVDLSQSIFLVGSFRTGSTGLHRLLSLDHDRFISPRFMELFFPFLSLHLLWDYLHQILDDKTLNRISTTAEQIFFGRIFGDDITSRHPMSFRDSEEDDILLASWHKAGWYTGNIFPDPRCWMISGRLSDLPPRELNRILVFYERCMQKILWRRGGSTTTTTPPQRKILLSKSHLIDLMPSLARNNPQAKFVGIVRHPKHAFVSWYGLAQSSLKRFTLECITPKDMAIASHLLFWDSFTRSELSFFETDNSREKNHRMTRTVLTFEEYKQDHCGIVRKLYDKWGFSMSDDFEESLRAETVQHKSYKRMQSYRNPSLEDLGIDGNELEERFKDYIETFRL